MAKGKSQFWENYTRSEQFSKQEKTEAITLIWGFLKSEEISFWNQAYRAVTDRNVPVVSSGDFRGACALKEEWYAETTAVQK